LAAATLTTTAALAPASAARTAASRAGQHRIRCRAKAVIGGSAKSVEDGYNNKGNSDDQKGIFSCILPGLLSPEPLEKVQHGNTFGEKNTRHSM
jgi:hypothetical protein